MLSNGSSYHLGGGGGLPSRHDSTIHGSNRLSVRTYHLLCLVILMSVQPDVPVHCLRLPPDPDEDGDLQSLAWRVSVVVRPLAPTSPVAPLVCPLEVAQRNFAGPDQLERQWAV